MNEDVLPGGALDKSISFGAVEPLHCSLLSHRKLLSPLFVVKFRILREARASYSPLRERGSTTGSKSRAPPTSAKEKGP
jgi:hypothetical protein